MHTQEFIGHIHCPEDLKEWFSLNNGQITTYAHIKSNLFYKEEKNKYFQSSMEAKNNCSETKIKMVCHQISDSSKSEKLEDFFKPERF